MFESVTSFLESSREPRTFNESKFIEAVHSIAFALGDGQYAYDYQLVLSAYGIDWDCQSLISADYNNLDSLGVFSLIVGAVRADHMSNGALEDDFLEPGFLSKWLAALKQEDEKQPRRNTNYFRRIIKSIRKIDVSPGDIACIRYIFRPVLCLGMPEACKGIRYEFVTEIYPDRTACFYQRDNFSSKLEIKEKIEFSISKDEPCGSYEYLVSQAIAPGRWFGERLTTTVVLKSGEKKTYDGTIMALCVFEGKVEKKIWELRNQLNSIGKRYRFVRVSFSNYSINTYDYRYYDSMNLRIGDMVKVRTSHGDCAVRVEDFVEYTLDKLPLPLEKYKWIEEKLENYDTSADEHWME